MRPSLGLALLGLASGAPACHTGDRLWRITPFEGDAAGDRVNLWPLAYRSGSETAVLWPLFDLDERGFALRPLVAKDGTGFSVLYPLASFDTDADEGWIGPFYRFRGNSGLFPLANLGAWSWVGPVWWHAGSGGLFPLAGFDGFNYVGPLWWTEGEHAKGGLFPLATFAGTSHVGPLWWRADGQGFGLFPLFGRGLFGVDHLGPLWMRRGAEDERGARAAELGLFPLLRWADGGRRFQLLPLYAHELSEERSERDLLLGLAHRSRGPAGERSWVLPLWFRREEPGRSDAVLLPFLWRRERGERSDVYTLLGNRSVAPGGTSWNVYPLWWSSTQGDDARRMLLPFFYYRRAGDRRTLVTPLGGRGWSAGDGGGFVNVLGPLYHHSEDRRREQELTAFLWPLFERERDGEERSTRIAGLYARTSRPEGSDTSFLFGLGHARGTEHGSSHRLWPLYSWSDEEDVPGLLYDLTLLGRSERQGATRRRLFPLFSNEEGPERSEWNALFGLAHRARSPSGSSAWVWPLVARSRGSVANLADVTALVGWSGDGDSRRFQLGASLVYSTARERRAGRERERSRALLLFTHEEQRFVGAHVPAPEPLARENLVRREARGFLFDAFLSERESYSAWREGSLGPEEARVLRAFAAGAPREPVPDRAAASEVLAAHGVAVPEDDPAGLRGAIESFAAENARTIERRRLRVPFLLGYERGEDELAWSGPLGLVRYERDPERSRLRLLYYGYRSETRGGRTRRDVFPFITWDTGPSETRFSFLWRLLRYERVGERRGGHVLFVPWGDG